MHAISAAIRGRVLNLLSQGKGVRMAASMCRISKSSVQLLRESNIPNIPIPKGGHLVKLSARDRRSCVLAITSGRCQTGIDVSKILRSDHNIGVCDRTVRHALRGSGLAAVEKKARPRLSKTNIKTRLEFAKRHKDWTVDDWKRAIWPDETKVGRLCSEGRFWCWVRDGEERNPRQIKQTVKHSCGSLMIWGCMTDQGPGFMCKIDSTMDKEIHMQILQGELLQTIKFYGLSAKIVIFQHGNDPKHTAKCVKEWLTGQPFDVLKWQTQSPVLNPIEHLWAQLKRRLATYGHPPTGMTEIWERVQEEWEKSDQQFIAHLIESMPLRVQAVLKEQGKWIDH